MKTQKSQILSNMLNLCHSWPWWCPLHSQHLGKLSRKTPNLEASLGHTVTLSQAKQSNRFVKNQHNHQTRLKSTQLFYCVLFLFVLFSGTQYLTQDCEHDWQVLSHGPTSRVPSGLIPKVKFCKWFSMWPLLWMFSTQCTQGLFWSLVPFLLSLFRKFMWKRMFTNDHILTNICS